MRADEAEDGDGGGKADHVKGRDAARDDEALDGGEPGGAAFGVGGLEEPVGLERDGEREQIAQGQDGEDGERERDEDGDQAVHAFVVEGDGRGIERALDDPAEGESGAGEQDQAVGAAAREGLPDEGEGGLFARVLDPHFEEAGGRARRSVRRRCEGGASSSRRR